MNRIGRRTIFGINRWQFVMNQNHNESLSPLAALARRNMASDISKSATEGVKMLTTGNQLKAARALVGISQGDLAKAAKINVATISAMEGKGAAKLTSGVDTVCAVVGVLEAPGLELLRDGARLRPPAA